MYPELINIGGYSIYSYGFCIMFGVFLGFLYLYWHRSKFIPNSDKISGLMLLCFVSVFVGGKVFFFLEKPGYYIENPSAFFENLGQGFVFYGSFLFTIPALIWWLRKNKYPLLYSFDFIGIAGALVHGFGKIGCFLAGCCHGKVCSPKWGVVFNHSKTVADPSGVPLYPVQLWDSIMILSIVLIMIFYRSRKKFDGELFLIYTLLYAIGRFVTENYRGDDARGFLFNGAITHSQFIALLLIIAAGILYFLGWKSKRKVVFP